MDIKKIGIFLSQLRREQGLTQEQLGEKIGVTNKTVSRWENGNYMPPVEILQILSELYSISINEILSGERITESEYREKAEENFRSTLETSPFTAKEKLRFYKRKWSKEHWLSAAVGGIAVIILLIWGYNGSTVMPNVIAPVMALAFYLIRHNIMMAYAEEKVFGEAVPEVSQKKNRRLLFRIQTAFLLLFCVSVIIASVLGAEFFYSLVPEINDGVTIHSALSYLIFGDSWSRARFLSAFLTSLDISCILLAVYTVLALINRRQDNSR